MQKFQTMRFLSDHKTCKKEKLGYSYRPAVIFILFIALSIIALPIAMFFYDMYGSDTYDPFYALAAALAVLFIVMVVDTILLVRNNMSYFKDEKKRRRYLIVQLIGGVICIPLFAFIWFLHTN